MQKLIFIVLVLLVQGCSTYSQAYHSSSGNGIVLYSASTNPADICKYEFNRHNSYPETTNYWDVDYSKSTGTMFISGSFRRNDASLKVHQVKCQINYYTIEGARYIGIKGVNTLYPQGPAIGWTNAYSGIFNPY